MLHQHAVKTRHEILEWFFPQLGCEILNHKLVLDRINHKTTTKRVSIEPPPKTHQKFKVRKDWSHEELSLPCFKLAKMFEVVGNQQGTSLNWVWNQIELNQSNHTLHANVGQLICPVMLREDQTYQRSRRPAFCGRRAASFLGDRFGFEI